jgi:hypothetical protein
MQVFLEDVHSRPLARGGTCGNCGESRRDCVKYVIDWKRKRHGTAGEYEEGQRRVLSLLHDWRRPEGVTIHQWVMRAGASGGYAVIETDDLALVQAATRVFSGLNFSIEPVLDVEVALAAAGHAIEWRDSVV